MLNLHRQLYITILPNLDENHVLQKHNLTKYSHLFASLSWLARLNAIGQRTTE